MGEYFGSRLSSRVKQFKVGSDGVVTTPVKLADRSVDVEPRPDVIPRGRRRGKAGLLARLRSRRS